MISIFPIHPYIFNFITCLRHQYEFQHHQAEEPVFNIHKRRRINENIDFMLEFHLNELENGHRFNTEFVVKLGETEDKTYH